MKGRLLFSKKVTLWRAEFAPEEPGEWLGVPGQVAEIHRVQGWIDVLCIDGKLRVTEIERNGLRQSPAKSIRSIRTRFSTLRRSVTE
jgi:methionyl-tRNA formyltransferase